MNSPDPNCEHCEGSGKCSDEIDGFTIAHRPWVCECVRPRQDKLRQDYIYVAKLEAAAREIDSQFVATQLSFGGHSMPRHCFDALMKLRNALNSKGN